jgi:hypothetical protein
LDENGVKIGAEFMPDENIYLIDDIPEGRLVMRAESWTQVGEVI